MSGNKAKTEFEEEFEDTWNEPDEEACLPDPEDEVDEEEETDPDVEEAYQLVSDINDLTEEVPEEAEVFASNVSDKASAIQRTIEETERATPGQLTALKNMKAGLEKWIRT